jgi:Tfp pilus assembly protein PilX
MTAHRQTPGQTGAITLLVAIGLVILASLTSFYSARSALMDQLASQNHAHASQARLSADAALASAQAALPFTASPISALLAIRSPCPAGVAGPQWQCSALAIAPHPAMAQTQLSAVAVRDLVMSPHVLTLHASASSSANNSKAHARESLFVPTVAPAPDLPAHAALVLNGCVSEAVGASLRVCPLVSEGGSCTGSAKGPAVLTHFLQDTNGNGSISSAEENACLALKTTSLPGGGGKAGPSASVARSPCNRAAWRSVLGDITDEQMQAWSAAQEANGLTAQTDPPRSVYWIDSPADWQISVGTPATPAVLLFSAKACAQRCPHMGPGVRIVGSVLLDSGCNDEKMRSWQGGTIEGQLVVESGLPEWRSGTVLARLQSRDAYILNWPEGINARQVQRINGSWSEGKP